jgi:hypothetical protein
MDVSIYFIYILVENISPKKNNKKPEKSKINSKYLQEIKNYHKHIKSAQLTYDEYIKKEQNSDKKQKQKKHIKNNNSNLANKNNIKNPGIRLYEENIGHVSKKVQSLKEKLEEQKKLEDLKLTFKPKINDYSRKLVENNYNGIKIENRLINFGKIYENKNKSQQNIKNETNKIFTKKDVTNIEKQKNKKRKNLTPINNLNYIKKSKIKLDLNKTEENSRDNNKIKTKENKSKRNLTPDNNLYEYLYLESKLLKQKRDDAIQKNLDLTCPFKPKLNDSFNKNIKNNEGDVFQRLYNIKYENRKLATEMKLKKKFNFYSDDNTPDFLYKKNIKKYNNIKTDNNNSNRDSSKNDNSYINSINRIINEDNIDKDDFNKENKKNYIKKSYITILKAKYIKYFELFNSLDSDKDGIISYKKIKLSNIDTEKLISLAPILYEIQYKGLELDFQAFYEKIKNLN